MCSTQLLPSLSFPSWKTGPGLPVEGGKRWAEVLLLHCCLIRVLWSYCVLFFGFMLLSITLA